MITSTRTPLAFLLALSSAAHAGPRVSEFGDYTIVTDTLDAGGSRAAHAGTVYTNDGSLGGISGVSTAAEPSETVKAGFFGQLYDIAGFELTSPPPILNESGSLQLGAAYILDDATLLAIDPAAVSWSLVGGPLSLVSTAGIAFADIVYQDTPATVQGTFGIFTDTLDLTVMDGLPDNFGSYAGDDLDDSWQFQYFGLDNPAAAPGLDPDGDGQDNKFEFIAGIIPTDPTSRFLLRIEPVLDEPAKKDLIFSPIVEGRTYTVVYSESLAAGSWGPLASSTENDEGNVRTVTDNAAAEDRKFYHVVVEKP